MITSPKAQGSQHPSVKKRTQAVEEQKNPLNPEKENNYSLYGRHTSTATRHTQIQCHPPIPLKQKISAGEQP